MANISITLQCNQQCAYCFTRDMQDTWNGSHMHMSREIFVNALNFMKESSLTHVHLLGGEPTLHPDFIWFVEKTIHDGFSLLIFSNGFIPEKHLQFLERFSPEQIKILVNINLPQGKKLSEPGHLKNVLQRLGNRAMPGVNICTSAFDMSLFIPIIDRYKLSRTIRLGLAHPLLRGTNTYLHPKDYAAVGKAIRDFVPMAAEHGIAVEFDCGFVPCMFTNEFIKSYGKDSQVLGLQCGSIPDILPDGSVIPCYPLGSMWRTVPEEGQKAHEINTRFTEELQPYRTLGIYRSCWNCVMREKNRCHGGCLAAAMNRLRPAAFSVEVKNHTRA